MCQPRRPGPRGQAHREIDRRVPCHHRYNGRMQTLTAPDNLTAQTQAARAAQKPWSALSVRDRLRLVERFRRALVSACDRLCAVIGEEIAKPAAEVISGEIVPTADACAFLVREAEA